jgi:crotonobetaine/carnitine-CoA ligase
MNESAWATFDRRWRATAVALSEHPFLTFEDPAEQITSWTYGEFDDLVAAAAGQLVEQGAGPSHPVHLALANSPAFVALWLAAVRIGAPIVPADPRATTRELADSIARTAPAVGVCARDRSDAYAPAAAGGPSVVQVDEADIELGDLRGSPLRAAPTPPRPADPAAVMFTSGTTSAPKGVVVTQGNYAFTGDVMAAAAALAADDRQLVVLPMFHANAQYYSFAAAIAVGASVALMHEFSASGFVHQAARHAASHASLFAAPMRMILARGAEPVAECRLRHVWYAQNVSNDQYDVLSELFGCRPRQLYGMTETIPAVLTNRAVDPEPSSLGTATLGCTVDLWATKAIASVPVGEVGEIVVGGTPGITLFDGYLDDPDTTNRAFEKGWFRTGDLATRDDAGRFFFAGRGGDVLKVAGENVSTIEIESVLAEHESVLEAAVVAVPDPIRDEVPVAYVVRAPREAALDPSMLEAHCDARLAPSKRPRAYHLVDELPRTSVGKIKKYQLTIDAKQRSADAREAP